MEVPFGSGVVFNNDSRPLFPHEPGIDAALRPWQDDICQSEKKGVGMEAIALLVEGRTMPASKTKSGHDIQQEEVLTLPEAAAFLRVSEEDLTRLLAHGAIPAQQIGSEWRFLKRAL